MSKISDMIRTKFGATDTERDKGLVTPDDVVRFDNIPYGSLPEQQLDVYRPNDTDGVLPLIISVHGGGWVYGDKERYQFYCMSLAQRGFAVINYSYRLAPEHKFPAALEDTALVFAWAKAQAETYGFDMNHLFAVGDSAGANLLELYCALCTNEAYRHSLGLPVTEYITPKAVALNCGVHFITVSENPNDQFTTELMKDYLKSGGSEEELRLVNVSDVIVEGFPPAYIMTAENDFLKFQVPQFCEHLLQKNIPFIVKYYKDKEEQLGHVFHLDIRSAAAKKCNDEECAFFKSML